MCGDLTTTPTASNPTSGLEDNAVIEDVDPDKNRLREMTSDEAVAATARRDPPQRESATVDDDVDCM